MNRLSLRSVPPSWFTTVMGTGIIADAASGFPYAVPGMHTFALIMWLAASVLLILVVAATVAHWIRHPEIARTYHRDPITANYYGAVPMALVTVGAGSILVGHSIIGMTAAVVIDTILWSIGTALGLVVAITIPYLAFTAHEIRADSAFGGWLMPVLPPMVSAAVGPLLLDHIDNAAARQSLVFGCLAMCGMTSLAAVFIGSQIWGRLLRHKLGPPVLVPTLWIPLGPLGQFVSAFTLLARDTGDPGLRAAALYLGTPILGFAAMWLVLVFTLTVRTARHGMPFALTWWSFTFPVGACAVGAEGLAALTGLTLFKVCAVLLFVLLCAAWGLVAARTAAAQRDRRIAV